LCLYACVGSRMRLSCLDVWLPPCLPAWIPMFHFKNSPVLPEVVLMTKSEFGGRSKMLVTGRYNSGCIRKGATNCMVRRTFVLQAHTHTYSPSRAHATSQCQIWRPVGLLESLSPTLCSSTLLSDVIVDIVCSHVLINNTVHESSLRATTAQRWSEGA
jgi:hypothetical protein